MITRLNTRWLRNFFSLLIIFFLWGCEPSGRNRASQTAQIKFNFSINSILKTQNSSQNSSQNRRLTSTFSDDQLMPGSLNVVNGDTDQSDNYSWSVYLNEENWSLQSNRIIFLTPGDYTFSLLLEKDGRQYAGSAAGQVVDGTNDIALTIRPVIGDSSVDVSMITRTADFKFRYNPAELSAAGLSDPQIGVALDGGAEDIFALNPATGVSDNYISLSDGDHTIRLKLYDGNLQKAKSESAQENIEVRCVDEPKINCGSDLVMDLKPLAGDIFLSLNENGGSANFSFNFPAEIAEEAGELDNLRVLLAINGDRNTLREETLNLESTNDNYKAEIVLDDIQYDELTLALSFVDIQNEEVFGSCNKSFRLSRDAQNMGCALNLRRRAVSGGSLMSVLNITALDQNGRPVAGARVMVNDMEIGLSSGGFGGTPIGYIKHYVKSGTYNLRAEANGRYGIISDLSVSPLAILNPEILMEQSYPPTPGNSGALSADALSGSSLRINWTIAGDGSDESQDLQYKVVRSDSDNIGDASQAEANGVAEIDWTNNIDSAQISGLSLNVDYYFNVLARRDSDGATTAYNTLRASIGERAVDQTIDITPLNKGILAKESTSGEGYILYSAEAVQTRFADHTPSGNNADHFISVICDDGVWKYDNNTYRYAFSPKSGDLLVAEVNFDSDVVVSLEGQSGEISCGDKSLAFGYSSGDLVVTPNRYDGKVNQDEFELSGSYINVVKSEYIINAP